ncbi:5-hydroxytryptamine receptor 1A isoform X1 [Drosophila obscura]|uniref:5-hydroxytryptamine receptor 1A isoform X1 n=1 Tax=Drosophila obscura TaxID=7282 RepID=UPI000BA12CD8|nr:5-hydroxytryptamine receptor 1A isoform X1 [Drosophila obscura]XP_022216099.1 5-hydroxytryptamine receptor 1A isoform X1 [Drosophila obscura]XP_022216100.1 5-hydroxytryptamine receptor 1A isoform X1 [Drosophila obscura]XP_041450990.1 5-hydroxytryptamine receptor 1A isoform X1 [Drosophila obscura]
MTMPLNSSTASYLPSETADPHQPHHHQQTMLLYSGFLSSALSGVTEDSTVSMSTSNSLLLIQTTTSATSEAAGLGSAATSTLRATAAAAVLGVPSVNSYLVSMAWPKSLAVALFLVLILVTVVGNTLVILAVMTTRRLRTVTNCFVMNLAITDWLVGTCVMPPSVILYITGTWRFGWILCDVWISLDILLCTGSILSLCAISLDRYLAVTQPLTYSKKRRSKRLALLMILVVWITALSITCPPYLGWYEAGRHQEDYVDCRYNQNKGYVVFSAMGSFFIPLTVMLYVYVKIGYVLTSRRQRIVRDANSERTADCDVDGDNFISESEHYHCTPTKWLPHRKSRWRFNSLHEQTGSTATSAGKQSLKCSKCQEKTGQVPDKTLTFKHQPTFYELVEVSRLSSLIHCSAISCKYGGPCIHSTPSGLHYTGSQASFSETCMGAASNLAAESPSDSKSQQQQFDGDSKVGSQAALQKRVFDMQHHNHGQHNPHRMPMRVSTTKRDSTKTAKTLTIVMGGLIACWLPFFVYYLLIPFLPRPAVLEDLMFGFTWVGWVNCAINPFIYAFYNPDFRTAFWRLTCRPICKPKRPPNHLAMFRG